MEAGFFSIGDAAKQAHMTPETLRHYDRIGLVKPGKIDARTGYRYYSADDIVRLNTVGALRQMDLPLQEIKQVLDYDDLGAIVAFLEEAEQRADEKIALLRQSKSKIRRARASYEEKARHRRGTGCHATEENVSGAIVAQRFPERVIMLGDSVETVTADDLWSYLRHFYRRLSPEQQGQFAFEDLAGVYRQGTSAHYFAVCTRFAEHDDLKILPVGTYLCADCTEEHRQQTLEALLDEAETAHRAHPDFSLQLVVVSGILQWTYQLQVYVGA